jgi:lycopene cyclase domain-containing protein
VIAGLGWVYAAVLIFSLVGMTLIDWKYRLAFFAKAAHQPRAAILTVAVALVGFIAIDIIAIASGWFVAGESTFATGIFLFGEVPLEEPLFLLLMVYTGLILAEVLARRRRK